MNQKNNAVGARRNTAKRESRILAGPGFSLDNTANNAIKVFVGTHKTQGQRKTDFCWTHDGEPLYIGFECDSDQEPDDQCGCHRSFCGMSRHVATTTAEVVEYTGGIEAYVNEYIESMKRAGWLAKAEEPELEQWREDFRRFLRGIQKFPVGAVVEKRGPYIQVREIKVDVK